MHWTICVSFCGPLILDNLKNQSFSKGLTTFQKLNFSRECWESRAKKTKDSCLEMLSVPVSNKKHFLAPFFLEFQPMRKLLPRRNRYILWNTSHFSNSSVIIINELNVAKCSLVNGFLVSKQTVVLHRWERSKQKFGFIKRVDKGWITTVKDLESSKI